MNNQIVRVGEVIREHRESVGLTQLELAREADSSESMIQKLERGARGGDRPLLKRIFTALDIFPLAQEYIIALAEQPREVQARVVAAETVEAECQDVAMLNSLIHPGCLLRPGSFDIVAVNDAFRQVFPGATEIGNFLYYQFLEPRSKYVVVDWEAQSQLFAGAFHCIGPAIVSKDRWIKMTYDLGQAPEFDHMFRRRFAADEFLEFTRTVTTRNPRTDQTQTWFRNVTSMLYPDQRSTWYMTFHPA